MSEYINKEIFENKEFKHMQDIANEVRGWPEWKRNLSGVDNYHQSRMETQNNPENIVSK